MASRGHTTQHGRTWADMGRQMPAGHVTGSCVSSRSLELNATEFYNTQRIARTLLRTVEQRPDWSSLVETELQKAHDISVDNNALKGLNVAFSDRTTVVYFVRNLDKFQTHRFVFLCCVIL